MPVLREDSNLLEAGNALLLISNLPQLTIWAPRCEVFKPQRAAAKEKGGNVEMF